MSYGSPMTANIPTVGASGTQYATDVNEFLTEVRTTLESDVPFSALSGDELDLNNVPILDAEYITFYDQSVTPAASPTGRLESYQGNLYWVNTSGAVRLTSGAAIDVTTSGGIGGDYGTGPEGFNFVNASARYEAYDNDTTNAWAYFRCFGVDIAAGSTSTNMAQLRYGGAASLTFTFPATLPASNRSVVVVSSAGQLAFNDATDTITNDIVLGGTTKIQHGDRKLVIPLDTLNHGTGSFTYSGFTVNCGVLGNYEIGIKGLQENYRIKSVVAIVNKPDATTTTIQVYRYVALTNTSTNLFAQTDATSGVRTITVTFGTPEVVGADEAFWVQWQPGATSEILRGLHVVYDVVA